MATRKLKGKQLDFVTALPKCHWVGTDAALAAGYGLKSRQTAGEIASQLLKKPHIKEAVEHMMEDRLQRAGIYAEKVLLELGKIGFSNVKSAYNEDGTLKLPKDWPEEIQGVISSVESFEQFSGKGKDRALIGFTKKLRTYDKVKALDLLGKHLRLFPTEKRGEEEIPSEDIQLTNLELSAKIMYLIQLAIQRQQEKEDDQKQNGKPKLITEKINE